MTNPWLLLAIPALPLIIWALADYESFWYHLEFWLPPCQRRPFTFIMRDLYHQAAGFVVPFLGFGFTAVGALLATRYPEHVWLIIGGGAAFFFPGELVAHLFWGKDYVPGQMPPEKIYMPSARVRRWAGQL